MFFVSRRGFCDKSVTVDVEIDSKSDSDSDVRLFCLRHLGWSPSTRLPSYNQRLMLISLLTFVQRRKMPNGVFIHKPLSSNICSSSLLFLIKLSVPIRSTRSKVTLCLPFSRSNFTLHSNFFLI